MQMIRAALLAFSLILSACQRDESVHDASGSSGVPERDSALVAQSTTSDTGVLLALDGEGLRIVLASTGSTRLLAFGMDSNAVITAVSAALTPPASRGTSAECGAGPMDFAMFADGLSINMQQGRFVGWSARENERSKLLTTMSGIGVGSTRAALDSVYAATVSRSTLGAEFTAGGLAGVLDGESASARITNLWAGLNCIAR